MSEDALAEAAVAEIRDGMLVGLGTGRAASRAIRALARRTASEHLDVRCVATSSASEALTSSLGLHLESMEGTERLDCLIDGADEVDPALRMLKGRGGAMTREKIVAHAAARRLYLVDATKLVARLGERAKLPVEIMAFGLASTRRTLHAWGFQGSLRTLPGGAPYETDNGHPVVDLVLPEGCDLDVLGAALDGLPGVVGHGLFLREADVVLVEDERGGVTRRTRPEGRAAQ